MTVKSYDVNGRFYAEYRNVISIITESKLKRFVLCIGDHVYQDPRDICAEGTAMEQLCIHEVQLEVIP